MTIYQVWTWDTHILESGRYEVHSSYTSAARAMRVRQELAQQEDPQWREGVPEAWTSPKMWPIEVIEGD